LFILREVVFPGLQRFAFSMLPSALRIQGVSYFKNYALDLRDRFKGDTDPEIPPRHLNISGAGPFRTFGKNTVDLCRQHASLAPDDVVVDIGCGIGRTALALSDYLTAGEYYGFDVIEFAIEWCRQHIETSHANFHFVHADIFNLTYNPRGKVQAERFVFPYADGIASFALATSLFTHMLPNSVENYLSQASRVLKSGGRFLSTWFLLDDSTERAMSGGRTLLEFKHRFARHAQASLHSPEQAVAFPRSDVEHMFEKHGFFIRGNYPGDWTGISDKKIHSMQDLIIAIRR
jgi:SAM-dependent methyltransferase